MKTFLRLAFLFVIQFTWSQVNYGTPTNEALPNKLQGLKVSIDVMHFPKETDPVKIEDRYYWKHATSILCKESEVTITEYGAYLFYNGTWNLRKSYPIKDLDKTFDTKKNVLLQGQPYTWQQNWRIDTRLFGGWAMWYFIGTNKNGETVCGYETIHTTDNLLN